MAFGKSKQKQSQELNPWAKQQWTDQTRGMQQQVDAYTSKPFNPYQGEMVAGMTDSQKQFRDMAQRGSGASSLIGDAVNAANDGGSMQWTPESVAGPDKIAYRGFDADRVRQRYNPYEQDVVNSTAAYYDRALQESVAQNSARATQSGAYGGSRHGVTEAELMRSSGLDKARMMADLRYRGYADAMAGDERETQGIYGADQYNSSSGYQARMNDALRKDAAAQFGVQQKFNQAGILSGLASQKDASFAQQGEMLARAGATEREIEQARLLASRAEFDRQAAEEYRNLMLQLQTRGGILNSTPMLVNSTGKSSGFSFDAGKMFSGGGTGGG